MFRLDTGKFREKTFTEKKSVFQIVIHSSITFVLAQ